MNIRRFFTRKPKDEKEKSFEERLHEARLESLRKKTAVADQIIGMMKDCTVERRIVLDDNYHGPERRAHA